MFIIGVVFENGVVVSEGQLAEKASTLLRDVFGHDNVRHVQVVEKEGVRDVCDLRSDHLCPECGGKDGHYLNCSVWPFAHKA